MISLFSFEGYSHSWDYSALGYIPRDLYMTKILITLFALGFSSASMASTPLFTCQGKLQKEKTALTVSLGDDLSADYVTVDFTEEINDVPVKTEYFSYTAKDSTLAQLQSNQLYSELLDDNYKDIDGAIEGFAVLMINAIPNDPNKMYEAELYGKGNTYLFICVKHGL